ncbi:hypothetical protein VTL71DRAFT_2988 [Oculimacula yallundae]|uniref:Uncharacterized protein n=1 Tax=Oculimacula yallundae TaxID=86028 RepID=A0ABR4C5U3_9HELO
MLRGGEHSDSESLGNSAEEPIASVTEAAVSSEDHDSEEVPKGSATAADLSTREHEDSPMLRGGESSDSGSKIRLGSYRNKPHDRPRSSEFAWTWKWELLSLLGTTMSLIAIVIILNQYDGKPSPRWPHAITLNTLVSVFATLLKAMMMMAVAECISQLKWIWFKNPRSLSDLTTFENASRGPWGSVQLLFTLQFHHLAVLGALVTVVTIAVDPFVQQTIRFYSCSYIEMDSLASVPISQSYAPKQNLFDPLEVGMIGAIYDGLLNQYFNGSTVVSTCPTGNCTFPIKYTTFGVCNSCTNLAYDIQNDFVNVTYEETIRVTHRKYKYAPAPRIILNSTLAGSETFDANVWKGISLIQPPFDRNVTTPPVLILSPTWKGLNFTRFPQSTPCNDPGFSLAGFTSLYYTRNTSCTSDWMLGGERQPATDCLIPALLPRAKDKIPTCQTSPMDEGVCVAIEDFDSIAASTCELSFSGKTYEGVVSKGVFSERPVGISTATEIIEPGYGSNPARATRNATFPAYLLSPCWYNNTEYKNIYEYLGFNVTEALWNYGLDIGFGNPAPTFGHEKRRLNLTYMEEKVESDLQKKTLFNPCVVKSTRLEDLNLADFLYQFLEGNVTGSNMVRGTTEGISDPGINWASWKNAYMTEWLSPMYAKGLATHETTQALFDRLAISMTNHMRRSDINGTVVQGQVNGAQTCVRVVWPWLALPAALILSTSLLLVATIVKTARQANTNVWKSSALPYLFHGLTEQGKRDVRGSLITVDEMDHVAGSKDALLTETDDGWRFVLGPRVR